MPEFDYTCEHLLQEVFGETGCSGESFECGCCADCGCFCGFENGTWELAVDENDYIVYRPKRETP
mgnify:CR=1 FL=1